MTGQRPLSGGRHMGSSSPAARHRREARAYKIAVLTCLAAIASQVQPAWASKACAVCPLDGDPVCGVDNIEYLNACIASCQGVPVRDLGPCGAAGPGASATMSAQDIAGPTPPLKTLLYPAFNAVPTDMRMPGGLISWADMMRMAPQGFRFVSRARVLHTGPQEGELQYAGAAATSSAAQQPPRQGQQQQVGMNVDPGVEDDVADADDDGTSWTSSDKGMAVAITYPDNLVYVQARKPDRKPLLERCTWGCGGRVASAQKDTGKPLGRRALQSIIGQDTRVEALDPGFPDTATFQIRFKSSNTTMSRCSAALISPSVVLTSGHCVYGSGEHEGPRSFYAQDSYEFWTRIAGLQGLIPFTAKAVKAVTTREWIRSKDAHAYDVAVIYLDTRIGDILGFFAAGYACQRENYTLSLLGFPGGYFAAGRRMLSTCQVQHRTCSDTLLLHTCDTEPGQSGSPMFTDNDKMLRAVHACSLGKKFNCGVMLRPSIFDIVQRAYDETVAA